MKRKTYLQVQGAFARVKFLRSKLSLIEDTQNEKQTCDGLETKKKKKKVLEDESVVGAFW